MHHNNEDDGEDREDRARSGVHEEAALRSSIALASNATWRPTALR